MPRFRGADSDDARHEELTDRVGALEASGAADTVTAQGTWAYIGNSTSPGWGAFSSNNDNIANATTLYFSGHKSDGVAIGTSLGLLRAGDMIRGIHATNSEVRGSFVVTGDASYNAGSDVATIPVVAYSIGDEPLSGGWTQVEVWITKKLVGTSSLSFEVNPDGTITIEGEDVYTKDAADSAFAATSHSHPISNITSLQASLDAKAGTSHSHPISNVTGLQSALDAKAASTHTHSIANVTGLQGELDGKSSTGHGHVIGDTTGLQAALDAKAPSSHSHTIANVTGLQAALDDLESTIGTGGGTGSSNGTIKPEDHGAVGDGTTDDTTAILAALAAARTAGVPLEFTYGKTHVINQMIDLDQDDDHVICNYAIFKGGNTATGDLDARGCYFRINAARVKLERPRIQPPLTPFSYSGSEDAAIRISDGVECEVDHALIEGAGGTIHGIMVRGGGSFGNKVTNCTLSNTAGGISYSYAGASRTHAENNYIYRSGSNGMGGTGNGAVFGQNNRVVNNTIIECARMGIEDHQDMRSTLFEGNTIIYPGYGGGGTGFGISAVADRSRVFGNLVVDAEDYAIESNAVGTVIAGNEFRQTPGGDRWYQATGIMINNRGQGDQVEYGATVHGNFIQGTERGIRTIGLTGLVSIFGNIVYDVSGSVFSGDSTSPLTRVVVCNNVAVIKRPQVLGDGERSVFAYTQGASTAYNGSLIQGNHITYDTGGVNSTCTSGNGRYEYLVKVIGDGFQVIGNTFDTNGYLNGFGNNIAVGSAVTPTNAVIVNNHFRNGATYTVSTSWVNPIVAGNTGTTNTSHTPWFTKAGSSISSSTGRIAEFRSSADVALSYVRHDGGYYTTGISSFGQRVDLMNNAGDVRWSIDPDAYTGTSCLRFQDAASNIWMQFVVSGATGISPQNAIHMMPMGVPNLYVGATGLGGNPLLGFYGTQPVAKPEVTGVRGSVAAQTSALAALASVGLITNSTTAPDAAENVRSLTTTAVEAMTRAAFDALGTKSATTIYYVLETTGEYATYVGSKRVKKADPPSIIRINMGSGTVAATDSGPSWLGETTGSPNQYRTAGGATLASYTNATVVTPNGTVPGYVPASVWQSEFSSSHASDFLTYTFPVLVGESYAVRLFIAELYSPYSSAGNRVLDVAVNGSVPTVFDNLDAIVDAGGTYAGYMKEHTLTSAATTLTVQLQKVTQNPRVNAIEIARTS